MLRAPDLASARRAVGDFLESLGFNLDNPHLKSTPSRVVESWVSQFLDGYNLDPAQLLADTYPAPSGEVIVIRDIRCVGLCPHHLLPFFGTVNIAYIPSGKIVGFSKLADLVRCFTRRLTLQEEATHQIAQSLVAYLGARGAACYIRARQMCLALLNPERAESSIDTVSFLGEFENNSRLQELIF